MRRHADTLGMRHIINYTPTDLPPALQRRMSQIRRARGTATAHAYAMAVLSHMRMDANVAYMVRFTGTPGLRALRALLVHGAASLLLLYMVWGTVTMQTFFAFMMCAGIYTVGHALAGYLDGGKQL